MGQRNLLAVRKRGKVLGISDVANGGESLGETKGTLRVLFVVVSILTGEEWEREVWEDYFGKCESSIDVGRAEMRLAEVMLTFLSL